MTTLSLVRPWTRTHERPAGDEVVVNITRLRLRRFRDTVAFLRLTNRVRRQLLRSPGALGVGLRAQPLRRQYYTVSTWVDEASMHAFAAQGEHRVAMRQMGRFAGDQGVFTSWRAGVGRRGRPRWREVERMAASSGAPSAERAASVAAG